ncbi:MAG: hypothetical protein M0024_08370 [Nitrospiraceae bacterium]|nr:hypothetical protein [Nitrospiraceae bacterium]
MFRRLRTDFLRGVEKVQWFSRVFSERLNIEIAVIKLLYRSDEVERKKNELLALIGNRVYELKDASERNPLRDRTIVDALAGIEDLDREMVELGKKIEDLSRSGA